MDEIRSDISYDLSLKKFAVNHVSRVGSVIVYRRKRERL